MPKRIKDTWNNLPNAVQKIASFITATSVVMGALVGVLKYAKDTMTAEVHEQIAGMEAQLNNISMDTTRLQLISLMHTDPDNVNAILIVAHKYFVEMHGDWYMTEQFKEWAHARNISLEDFTFVHE